MNKAVLQAIEPPHAANIVPRGGLRGVAFDEVQLSTKSAWVVKHLLPLVGVAQIYGDYGTGKSFLALDICHAVATGEPWRGELKTEPGMVLYLAAEGCAGVAKRMVALRQERPGHAPITLLGDQLDIRDPRGADQIIEQVRAWHSEQFNEYEPRLVVIDTFSQVCPGDQNGTEAMQAANVQLQRIASELRLCVLIVHHSGKDAARGPRGSNSLPAAMDAVIRVEGKENPRSAAVEKLKDDEGGQEFGFSLRRVTLGTDEDGDPITSCVLDHAEVSATCRPMKLSPLQKLAMDTLENSLAIDVATPPISAGLPQGVQAGLTSNWKGEFLLHRPPEVDPNAHRTFTRQCTSLQDKGLIQIRGDWVWKIRD